ncbi:MAG: hypothetical protein H7Y31_10480 [Chitinophagaceae bacterium]|nr:hypothetical protein [Chitinophagaceae bacterium]
MKNSGKILLILAILVAASQSQAQDTTRKKSIDITSTFKPVLREASKINFNAAPPVVDSSRPTLNYNIPSQNLFFAYQPAELKPVALSIDSLNAWQYSNFIKVGVGNVHLPYIKAGFSFGDGKSTYFNVFAEHYTSNGDLKFQKHSLTKVGAAATYITPKHLEWNGKLGFVSDNYYLYGFRPETLPFEKKDLKQNFQTIEGVVHLRNTIPTEFGLTYHPSLRVSVFSDNKSNKGNESNSVLDLPLEKTFGKMFAFTLGATADLTSYQVGGNAKFTRQNNLYYISPAVLLKTPNVYIHGGLRPSWDNKVFTMLPNVMADITTNDQRFTFQLGWIGYYNKGSYQRFAGINPWLAQPDSLFNTRVQERYAGFKGSVSNHFSYSAKVGFQQFRNTPLFVNDTIDGKTFLIKYEPRMEVLQLHGEVEYTQGEQFSASASLNFNQFTKLQREKKAWGMIPLELNAGVRWQLLKDLWLRADLWAWDGAQYQGENGEAYKGETGFDLNTGAEFRITKNFNLWIQLNNILNNKYERWHQYETFGFNILGGITYSFNQRK